MSLLTTVLIVAVSLIALYLIYTYFFQKSTTLSSMKPGTVKQIVSSTTLPSNNNSSNYTYSMWFYVDDWNYRFGEEKTLLSRLDKDKEPGPKITLGAMENDINIAVACYPQNKNHASAPLIHNCKVRNFPIQSWVNLIISLYGRTLDVYIDGKLVRTCVLPGVAKVSKASDIEITPDGGFNGWTSNMEYWGDATNPEQAYNIYSSGFGGSMLGNLFNKYRVKVSFMENNTEQSSFEI